MAGPAFEQFAGQTDRICPARHLRMVTPGDLSWTQETFEEQLSPSRRASLAQAERTEPGCMAPDGLACPTTRTLDALGRTGMLPQFSRFACDHVAPESVSASPATAAAPTVTAILEHLDLNSFPNSTGPRRQASLHAPSDYGFTERASFDDGWAEISEPQDSWHLSALLLAGGNGTATICFVDAGGAGATYRATQVLNVSRGADGRWAAVQVADRPECHNVPSLEPGARS